MNKESIVEILKNLGFFTEVLEDLGYRIEYEGIKIIIVMDEKGEDINLLVPNIFAVTDQNRYYVNEAIALLCGTVKYIQAYESNSFVWLNYVHYLGGAPITMKLLEHMIRTVAFATSKFHEIIGDNEDKR